MFKRIVLAIASAVAFPIPLVLGQSPAACGVRHYSVAAVPLLPVAVNDNGQVAGTTPNHRAALWSRKAGLHELPLPPGFVHSEAVAINNHGHVVGLVYDQTFSMHRPFIIKNGVLALLPGEQARVYHINQSSAIAGESLVSGKQKTVPVIWSGRSMQQLGGCCGGSAKGINEHGQAIGDAYDEEGRYYAYLWTKHSGLQRIGPSDRYSAAIAINNRGHVVIQAFPSVLLYADGDSVRLALAPKFPSHPRALNDCDVIVGSFGPYSDADRAFVWAKSFGFQDLNALIPEDTGWKLESATGINNRGEIVGKGDPPGADEGGFMLLPSHGS